MAVFRIEKTRDYTVMSNYHLRDMSLSLKAKGLLSLMLSLPENWDYTMKGLARICKDGIDSISGGIRELEAHGYLIRARVRGANGQLGSIRSREISASIILQSQSQLKTIYKDAADTIVGNCDSTLFLGGKEKGTLKEISELLGKETIDSLSQSENRGAQTSHGLSYQKLGKELMTQDEIAVMDGGKCILQLRGVRPFFSDKFDITKHPRYRYLSDADKKNVFDVERYMKRRPAIVKPDEPFDMYELNASDLEPDNNNSTKRKEK